MNILAKLVEWEFANQHETYGTVPWKCTQYSQHVIAA